MKKFVLYLLICLLMFGCVSSKEKLNGELLKAAKEGNTEKVKELIEKGANVNARDNVGKTALTYAKERGHSEIVELLIKVGAKE